jgi:hypothetical protein
MGRNEQREDELILATQLVVDQLRAFEQGESEQMSEPFMVAIDDCCTVWQHGDVPERCRPLLSIIERLTAEWRNFELYVSTREPIPRREFWTAIGEIANAITWTPPPVTDFYCESIAELFEQRVSAHQIATIYSHNGVGPFLVNGQPQIALVMREHKQPGSVLPKDFVHPRIVAEQEAAKRYTNFVAHRAQQLKAESAGRALVDDSNLAPVGQEPIEDLIDQGVRDEQIAVIKRLPIEEVRRTRAVLEANRVAAQRGRAVPFPNVTDRDVAAVPTLDAADFEADEAPQTVPTEAVILEYLANNPSATNSEAAKALGVDRRRVALARQQAEKAAA